MLVRPYPGLNLGTAYDNNTLTHHHQTAHVHEISYFKNCCNKLYNILYCVYMFLIWNLGRVNKGLKFKINSLH